MKREKIQSTEIQAGPQTPVQPRLVKAAEFAARREAAEAERAAAPQMQPRPVLRRAPRGEAEARQMFDLLFEAA